MTSFQRLRALAAISLLATPFALGAQANATTLRPPSQDTVARPAANPADVSSPDDILKALYNVISGPAGQKRDWNRFKSLVVPNGRFIPTVKGPNGAASARVMSADDYAAASGPGLERNGFFERQIATKTEEYGVMMHVFSTYESRRNADDAKPFARGINSIQLLHDGNRWWIVTVYWDAERPGNELPAKYLPPT
jgi:hypothetical protein